MNHEWIESLRIEEKTSSRAENGNVMIRVEFGTKCWKVEKISGEMNDGCMDPFSLCLSK